MTAQIAQAMAEVQRVTERIGTTIDPLQLRLEGTSAEATLTLQALRRTFEETQGLFTTDTGLGYGLEQALLGLRDAAAALRVLTLSLERNPDMLLRGK
jgi:paraquat-inducible protein B